MRLIIRSTARWQQRPLRRILCPSTSRPQLLNRGKGATDYGGIYGERILTTNYPPRGVFIHDQAIRFRDVTDGLD